MNIIVDNDFKVTPKLLEEIIDVVISKYGVDEEFEYGSLRNSLSPMYKLFAYLKNAETENQMILFYYIFYGIYSQTFNAEDIIRYHLNRGINISDESLEEFLDSVSTDSDIYLNYKKSMIKEAFNSLIFEDFYNYYDSNYNTGNPIYYVTDNDTDYKVEFKDSMNIADSVNNIIGNRVQAKINPNDVYSSSAYPDYDTAIKAYHEILKEYLEQRAVNENPNGHIIGQAGFKTSDYTFNSQNSGAHLTSTLKTLNTLFNSGDTVSGDDVVPEPFFLYLPEHATTNMIYNRNDSQKLSLGIQMSNRNPNLYIDRSLFNSVIDDVVTAIMNRIDEYNESIWQKYIGLGDQIYVLETKLRQLQIPRNIFSLYNENVQEFISDVKNVFVSLFSKHEQTVKTENFNVFDAVSYVYGVDFLFADDPLMGVVHYQQIYFREEKIYPILGLHLLTGQNQKGDIGESLAGNYITTNIKNYDLPVQYNISFTAHRFVEDAEDTACIYVKKSLILEKYRKIIDEIGYYEANFDDNGNMTGFVKFKKLDFYDIQKAIYVANNNTDDNGKKISEDDFIDEDGNKISEDDFLPQNVFRETPYLWKENIDFESEDLTNVIVDIIDKWDQKSRRMDYKTFYEKNLEEYVNNYYCFKIYINTDSSPYRNRRAINLGFGRSIRDKLIFEYAKTYSFFKTPLKNDSTYYSIDICATEDYDYDTVRSLYNLTSYVSVDRARMYQSAEIQKKLKQDNERIRNAIASTISGAEAITNGVINIVDRTGQFFKNIGTGITNVMNTIGDVLDFIPGRIRQGYNMDDLLRQLIDKMWETLESYRNASIKYQSLKYDNQKISQIILSDWETDSSDGISNIYLDASLYRDLIITPVFDSFKKMIDSVIGLDYVITLSEQSQEYITTFPTVKYTDNLSTYDDVVRLQKSTLAMALSKQEIFPTVAISEDLLEELQNSAITDEERYTYVKRLNALFAIFGESAQKKTTLFGDRATYYQNNFKEQAKYRENVISDLRIIKSIMDDFVNYLVANGHFIRNTWGGGII